MFTEALGLVSSEMPWGEDRTIAIATAALTGYYQLSLHDEGQYRNISADDFIATLVEMTTRIAPATHSRIR